MMNKIAGHKSAAGHTKGQTALEVSEARYRRLFETAQDGILILDAGTGRINDANPFLIEMLGYPKEEILEKKLWDIGVFKDIKASQKAFLELQTKEYVRYEDLPLETKDGRSITVEFISNVYSVGRQRVIQCNIRDITDRKKAEEIVQRSLKEKEFLLKELHHRVKNNLQIIASLLQLKLANSKDTEVIDVFKQTQERIRVMALVHQKLCETNDFMSIDISGYVHDLVNDLLLAYGVDRKKVAVKVNVAKVLLNIGLAVPCGLIINELLTNSFKYAFPGDRKGKISIALRSINKGTLEITVSDNGIGFRKDFNFRRAKTMGLWLVISTIESQLGGKVKLNRVKGAQFKMTFNI
ncbi:MAG: histidine kinase dimerization/phosphoacceptor domain -containing protein [Candidatus Omnitrophota bacterium]|jgi:PAS domain S-box-containing protein